MGIDLLLVAYWVADKLLARFSQQNWIVSRFRRRRIFNVMEEFIAAK